MPNYRVVVEHVTTTREVLYVTAQDVGDAQIRAEHYENNGRKARADVTVATPRDTFTGRDSTYRVLSATERA